MVNLVVTNSLSDGLQNTCRAAPPRRAEMMGLASTTSLSSGFKVAEDILFGESVLLQALLYLGYKCQHELLAKLEGEVLIFLE